MPPDKTTEYVVATEHVRHQDNVIFAHATLFATITGALLAFRYTTNPAPAFGLQVTIYLAGVLTSVSFWVNMEIYLYRFHAFFARAAALENGLDYDLYGPMLETKRKLKPGSWSWRSLFAFVAGFWIFSAVGQLGLGHAVSALVAILVPTLLQLAILASLCNKESNS